MAKEIDLTGQRFGRLTVKARAQNKHLYWLCSCECGSSYIASGDHLRRGKVKSCGCLRKEVVRARSKTHGMSRTGEYESWRQMIARCYNKNNPSYKNYGGRGITVCKRWMILENFYADMGGKPQNMTIERINNNKGYYPGNCKWATYEEQGINKRNNRLITYQGKTQCLSQWAKDIGVKDQTLTWRLDNYPPQIAFNM